MKQNITDKYSVAWFKLAECISKGERERAMGIYRLLAHSIDNQAFAKQLEADMYLFFNDNSIAQIKYEEAAMLYFKQNDYMQALSLYEQLISFDPFSYHYMRRIFECAFHLNHEQKLADITQKLIDCYLQNNDLIGAQTVFFEVMSKEHLLESMIPLMIKILLVHQTVNTDERDVLSQISSFVEHLVSTNNMLLLQHFLTELENSIPVYYQLTQNILKAQ